jgi:hypothetical protein
MGDRRLERLAPLTGALFAAVFAIGFVGGGDTPDTKASGEEVIAHYHDSSKAYLALFSLMIAGVLFLFFAGVLRDAMRSTDRAPGWLGTVAFGGAVVYAVALGIFGIGQVALADAADLGQPQVAQALNIFDNNNFLPAVIGLATIALAVAWHTLRSRMLPVWVGWVALVLGLLAFAGPAGFIAFLTFPILVLILSLLLYRQGAQAAA